ncbi:hypothetical protein pEaSNUABM29_00015 [Erwinia phage pEa_SNUABM_29]|nr:hypothetical protein pEaSNUABM29_00015 [Erwinia phage pEa_SNUABM_29]
MLKPRKRKKAIHIMRSKDGGIVGYRGDVRIPIPEDGINGILLVYSPDYRYPSAMKVIRGVLEQVRKGYVKTA